MSPLNIVKHKAKYALAVAVRAAQTHSDSRTYNGYGTPYLGSLSLIGALGARRPGQRQTL